MQNRVVSLSSQTLGVRILVATGLKGVVVPRDGPQPAVERPAPQGQPPLPRRTTPNVRPSWRVMVASKRPLRWNSTCERRPSMPGESDAASR